MIGEQLEAEHSGLGGGGGADAGEEVAEEEGDEHLDQVEGEPVHVVDDPVRTFGMRHGQGTSQGGGGEEAATARRKRACGNQGAGARSEGRGARGEEQTARSEEQGTELVATDTRGYRYCTCLVPRV